MEEVLDSPDLHLVRATSGNQALGMLIDHDYDLVLLDVYMPGMDGFEVAEIMRGHEKTKDIPIIFVTAMGKEQQYVFKGYELGAVDYLFKPIEPDILRSKVRVFCELGKKETLIRDQLKEIRKQKQELEVEVAERKQAEGELRKSEEKYRTIIENIEDGYYEVSIGGDFTAFNDSTCRILGYHRSELMGINYKQYIVGENAAYLFKKFNKVFKTGQPSQAIDYELIKKDGSTITVETLVSLMRDADGEAIGFRGILRDITARKRVEQALRAAKKQAEESNLAKSEFLANMSHEIRTPLNGIIGMTGLLLDTELTLEQREYAGTTRDSGNALLSLINDILDFSKIEAGKMELEEIDFDLRTCVEEVGDMLAQRAQEKGLELPLLFHYDVPTLVKGDPGRLRQILINLMNNAIKFTELGEVMVRVSLVNLTDTFQTVRFDVVDTGIGIPADRKDHLFDAFSQADTSTTRKYGGSGLGLAISSQLAEAMGGRIVVESEEGKGSVFSFTVGLQRQPDLAKQPEPMQAVAINDLRILIVDNNNTNRKVFVEQFKAWNCQTEEASNAAQAMTMLHSAAETESPFKVAILDFQLPDQNGEELAKEIRSDPAIAQTPLILATSVPRRGDADRMLRAGFDAYLTKPVKQSYLHKAVAAVLGLREKGDPEEKKPLVTRHSLNEAISKEFRLLLVEDNIVNQKVAARLVEKQGFRCDVAANGQEAVEALSRISYDAVLMDCQMPVMDGYEATAEIRKCEGEAKHTPIIALTANAIKGDRERCLESGMDGYITKPVTASALKKVLHKFLTPEDPSAALHGKSEKEAYLKLLGRMKELSGGRPGRERELINEYLEENEERLLSLEAAFLELDMERLRREARIILGASSNMSIRGMREIAERLERSCDRGQLGPVPDTIAKLKTEFDHVRRYLLKHLDSGQS